MARSITISRFATTATFTPDGQPGARADPLPGQRLQIPEKLGSVTLKKPLGEGGMGVVWLGRHELLERDVAVKFLLDVPRSGDDPNFAAFLQGARAAAATRHPGLNEVFHADVTPPHDSPAAPGQQAPGEPLRAATGGVPYLVMEYIDGPSLAEILKQHGPLPLPVVRAILNATCGAVAALHDHEVIHRDVKPANIMLTTEGRVVVTDFGLACPRPSAAFGASAGHLAGTPAYMAPEMFDGIVSARTDVYALAITAYQLLTGRLPFEGTVGEIRAAHKDKPLDHDLLAELHVPEPIVEALERAANKNVLFRPKSGRHALDLFDEAFRNAKITVASAGEMARLARGEHPPVAPGGSGKDSHPEVAYYDTISTLAAGKRKINESHPPPRVAKDDFDFEEFPPSQPPGSPPPKPIEPPKGGLSSWLKKLLGG